MVIRQRLFKDLSFGYLSNRSRKMYLSVCRAAALLDVTQSKGKLVSGGG
jgi:hypothetical protein